MKNKYYIGRWYLIATIITTLILAGFINALIEADYAMMMLTNILTFPILYLIVWQIKNSKNRM
jgi:prepilin signal peptidase PulO-like enzyme (type II secretory pathway)